MKSYTHLEKAVERLYSFVDNEKLAGPPVYATTELDIERFRSVLEERGNRQREFESVLIAGSKGKGSTAAMLDSILRARGLRVGLFTSPHLIDIRERIRIDGRCVDGEIFAKKIDELTSIALKNNAQRSFRTVFEILTGAAVEIFAESGVDIAIFEAGMGGRLDAVNAIEPSLSIITTIGIDHTHALGDTVAEIASEKAGILRSGVTAVIGRQIDSARRSINAHAAKIGAGPLSKIDEDWQIAKIRINREKTSFDLSGPDVSYEDLRLSLIGRFQAENAACAVAAASILGTGEIFVREGLSNTVWPARMQIFPANNIPKSRFTNDIIVDGAHSPMAFERIVETLAELWKEAKPVWVFAANRDKDIPSIFRIIEKHASGIVLTTFDFPRAASISELASIVQSTGFPVIQKPNIRGALASAQSIAESNAPIVVAGSLYLAGEALRELGFHPWESEN